MADQFTQTTTTNFFTRIINSVVGVFVGIILFIGSFALLYWNEGLPSQYNEYAKAIETSSDSRNSENEGKLIWVRGQIVTATQIGDNTYIKPSDYAVLERKVEMYAWKEETSSSSQSNTGGSETTSTSYNYSKTWQDSPSDSLNFKYPEGHANPAKSLESKTFFNTSAKLGVFSVNLGNATLPQLQQLQLTPNVTSTLLPTITATPAPTTTPLLNITITTQDTYLQNNYIYKGAGNLDNPSIGDIRISYLILPNKSTVTYFAKQVGENLDTYVTENGVSINRIFNEDRDSALQQVKNEDNFRLWAVRIVGFLMMWIGMMMALGPISVLSDFIPFIGKLTGLLLGLATFISALILTIATVVISFLLHNILVLAGMIVLVILIALVIGYFLKQKK